MTININNSQINTNELRPEPDFNRNKRLLEFVNNLNEQVVFIVYHYDRFGVDFLKAFLSKQDAKDYKRYYELTNFRNCAIERISLE